MHAVCQNHISLKPASSATSNENMKLIISSRQNPAVTMSLNKMEQIIMCQETPHHVATWQNLVFMRAT